MSVLTSFIVLFTDKEIVQWFVFEAAERKGNHSSLFGKRSLGKPVVLEFL